MGNCRPAYPDCRRLLFCDRLGPLSIGGQIHRPQPETGADEWYRCPASIHRVGPRSGRHQRRPRLYHVAHAGRKLEQKNNLRTLLSRPGGDFASRFPGILFWRKDFEALFSRYDHFVSVETDTSTGVTALRVKAYRPEDAHTLASALLSYSEQLINELNERARRDALDTSRNEVDRAEQRIAEIQTELTAYRVKQEVLDPKSAASRVVELIGL